MYNVDIMKKIDIIISNKNHIPKRKKMGKLKYVNIINYKVDIFEQNERYKITVD